VVVNDGDPLDRDASNDRKAEVAGGACGTCDRKKKYGRSHGGDGSVRREPRGADCGEWTEDDE